MHINCLTEELVRGVQTVERAAANKDTIPILTGILLDAGSDGIKFMANDLEIAMECTIAGAVLRPGRVVLEAKYLSQIVRHLPAGNTELRYDESVNSVTITAGKAVFTVNCLPADEFPAVPDFAGHSVVKVSQGDFKRAVEQTIFATGKDESRPFMAGILLEAQGMDLNLVATDSNRLSHRQISLEKEEGSDSDIEINVLVPTRTMNELLRLLDDKAEQTLEVVVAGSQIGFSLPETKLTSRLIEARFPNYRQVIPKEYTISLGVDKREFQAALQRSALIAKKGPAITVFRLENGILNLSSREAEVGSSSEQLEVEHDGDDIVIAYQAKYLLDVLKVMDSERVEMRLKPGIGAATVIPVGGERFKYVLMPVRVPEVMG